MAELDEKDEELENKQSGWSWFQLGCNLQKQ